VGLAGCEAEEEEEDRATPVDVSNNGPLLANIIFNKIKIPIPSKIKFQINFIFY
jgi:hypothetical protein